MMSEDQRSTATEFFEAHKAHAVLFASENWDDRAARESVNRRCGTSASAYRVAFNRAPVPAVREGETQDHFMARIEPRPA